MDAFDADVLIYAIGRHNELGRRVRSLFAVPVVDLPVGVGSVLLIPEVLSKPIRDGDIGQRDELLGLLIRLELLPTDLTTANLAALLGGKYRLKSAAAVHLATAVNAGADRFITNNRKDFPASIAEIDIVYPDQLPEP